LSADRLALVSTAGLKGSPYVESEPNIIEHLGRTRDDLSFKRF
jgi:hypothetical protein